MQTPYIRTCQKCDEDFKTSNPKTRYHVKCNPKIHKIKRVKTTEFDNIKNFIYLRDNHSCQLCNKDLSSDDFHRHAHHIDHNPNNNSTDNLVTLCNGCHSKTHQKGLTFEVEKIEIKKASLSTGMEASGKNQFKGV